MDCESAIRLIQAELDGSLSSDDRVRFEEHLALCPECRAERAVLAAIDGALATEVFERGPAWMAGAVVRGIERRRAVRQVGERVAVGIAAGAGTVAAASGVASIVGPEGFGRARQGLVEAFQSVTAAAGSLIPEVPGPESLPFSEAGILGVLWALAGAAIILVVIGTLRVTRQLTCEWREPPVPFS